MSSRRKRETTKRYPINFAAERVSNWVARIKVKVFAEVVFKRKKDAGCLGSGGLGGHERWREH